MADTNPSIGEILKTARQEQDLTLEEISLATRIREKYLVAIEADNWDVLPSSVQQKGFVRSYARTLDLDPAPLIQQLRSTLQIDDQDEDLEPEGEQTAPEPASESPSAPGLGEIGEILKTQREKLGFTILNVAEQIYIPERYLTAIEAGSLEDLPSTVQGKGMVKNYAAFLGLDPEPLLLNFADVLQSRLKIKQQGLPETHSRSPVLVWLRRFLANPTLLWAGLVVLIGVISIWAGALIFGGDGPTPDDTSTIPAVADILLPSSTPTSTPEALAVTPGEIEIDLSPTLADLEEGDPGLTPTPGLTGNEKVQVQLNILQRTWVRVTVDNILAYEGRLLPGSVKSFGGELSIEVLTGNAAGVEVIFNQRDLGVMGLYGEVIDRVFTAEGIATPTPTITLTPTPSDTPEPSQTPSTVPTQEGE